MILLFAILAPLFSSQWRRLAALGFGVIVEAFSLVPFGATLGLFLCVAFFVELLEQRLVMKEPAGWGITALSALGMVAFGEAIIAIAFDHIIPQLAIALLIREFFIGILIIGFLWMPVKLRYGSYHTRREALF